MSHTKTAWEEYCIKTLEALVPLFVSHHIVLDEHQPHISGERFLMSAITTTSGRKLILLGSYKGTKVVIKVSNEAGGIQEIEHERTCRRVVNEIDFSGETFDTPPELLYVQLSGYVITAQKYIEQESGFTERPLEEQFAFALTAFKAQESAHATTFKHRQHVARVFAVRTADTYIKNFEGFCDNLKSNFADNAYLLELLTKAKIELQEHKTIIEQYTGFLTHTDFVPHNIRISGGKIYLLDYSSLAFGNKYEGWARFINFMTLYNQPLEEALTTYVRDNRTPEELISLRMMRIYRLGEIIWYYVRTLSKSSQNLLQLNTARVHFWTEVLSFVLQDVPVPQNVITSYIKTRDELRSDDEKLRQKGLH